MTALIKSMKNFQFADKIYFCIALILEVNLKITLKKEYSEIQSGRITQGFNFKIVLSFQVFISRVSRVLLLSFQTSFHHSEKSF